MKKKRWRIWSFRTNSLIHGWSCESSDKTCYMIRVSGQLQLGKLGGNSESFLQSLDVASCSLGSQILASALPTNDRNDRINPRLGIYTCSQCLLKCQIFSCSYRNIFMCFTLSDFIHTHTFLHSSQYLTDVITRTVARYIRKKPIKDLSLAPCWASGDVTAVAEAQEKG